MTHYFGQVYPSMVAKPTKTCRMPSMMKTETNTELPDSYWEDLADQWETDNADIGSEFDS